MQTTVGKILIKNIVPLAIRNEVDKMTLDKKGISNLVLRIAKDFPQQYNDVISKLTNLGFEVSTRAGSTVDISDLLPPKDKDKHFDELEEKIEKIKNDKSLSELQKEDKYEELYKKFTKDLNDYILKEGLANNKTLAKVILSGSRGSIDQYRRTVAGSGLVMGNTKPMYESPIRHSFAEGLSSLEYLNHAFDERKNFVVGKLSVADTGYFCLHEETEVKMSDYTHKKIRDIKVGEYVLGANIKGDVFPVKVKHVFDHGFRNCFEYKFQLSNLDFINVIATKQHKVLAEDNGKFYKTKLEDVAIYDFNLVTTNGLASFESEEFAKYALTYDLEVDHEDHLFVLGNGMIVSNSKQLQRAGLSIKIEEQDCGTDNGISIETTDTDYVGSFLAKPVGGYNKNNEITSQMLSDLHNKKIDHIIVRNPITCTSSKKYHHNALCAMCVGRREKGIPKVGDFIGVDVSSAISEPLTQSVLGCLDENTEVRMADFSVKKIKDINIGDYVLGSDKLGNTFSTKVTNIFDKQFQECNEYIFKRGGTKNSISLIATPDHKILCNTYKTSCKEEVLNKSLRVLPIGYKCSKFFATYPNNYLGNFEKQPDEYLAFLLGCLIGDGCYTEGADGIHLSCADPSLIEYINKKYEQHDIQFKKSPAQKIYYRLRSISNKKDGACIINPVRDFLVKHGMYGKYAHEKVIPDIVMNWSNEAIAELLQGLFVTDGSIYILTQHNSTSKNISYGSTSKTLIDQIEFLLASRFCIFGRKDKSKLHEFRNYPMHNIDINTILMVERFATRIGFSGIKAQKSKQYECIKSKYKDIPFHKLKRTSEEAAGIRHVYDIEVGHEDSLFVLANGLIVSNSKHGRNAGRSSVGGFELINQLSNPPKEFKYHAPIAEVGGNVTKIYPLPQGGHEVHIKDRVYYVAAGLDLKVKLGQYVEKGQVLSEGVVNPKEVTNLLGIGEGRRHWSDTLHQTMKDSGVNINKRNLDLLANSFVSHVQITDNEGVGDHLPDDITHYQNIAREYTPRATAKKTRVDLTLNKYLEEPIFHYTIGTPITERVIADLKRNKVDSILVDDNPPFFQPVHQRLLDVPGLEQDWAHQFYGTYLEKKLIKGVNTGIKSSTKSPSPVLAIGLGKL